MARLKGFQELTSVSEALNKFFGILKPQRLNVVFVPVEDAFGRVTAKEVFAQTSLPSFNRSAVDGFALKAKDTVEASQFQSKVFRLVEKEVVGEGEAKRVWTGNTIPKGADAVVMLEHTKKTDSGIEVIVSLTPGANVSKKGEDIKKGEVAMAAGVRLTSYDLGLLAALGIEKIEVVRKPKAAVLATGSELVALGDKLKPSQIVEVNSIILSSMCAELGADAFSLGIAKDDENEIREKISEGLAKADMVITTGGTSVGFHDLVPGILEEIERHSVVVHGIAIRPGMPTALAVVHKKPVIVLSGNPVAAAIGFEVFTRPLIKRLLGTKTDARMKLKAKLTRRVAGVLGRRVFLRVKVAEKNDEFFAEPVRVKGSSIITTLTKANGYVIIPEDREGLRKDEVVTVYLFDAVSGEK